MIKENIFLVLTKIELNVYGKKYIIVFKIISVLNWGNSAGQMELWEDLALFSIYVLYVLTMAYGHLFQSMFFGYRPSTKTKSLRVGITSRVLKGKKLENLAPLGILKNKNGQTIEQVFAKYDIDGSRNLTSFYSIYNPSFIITNF